MQSLQYIQVVISLNNHDIAIDIYSVFTQGQKTSQTSKKESVDKATLTVSLGSHRSNNTGGGKGPLKLNKETSPKLIRIIPSEITLNIGGCPVSDLEKYHEYKKQKMSILCQYIEYMQKVF